MYCHPQAMQKVFTQHYYSSTAHSRNVRANSTGNSIKLTIPGLKNPTDIPFPDRKLPVCKRCKKIYKTRELCRVRDRHTEVPWSTTYICGTLDESCFNRGSDGEMTLVEEGPMRFIAHSVPSPPVPYRSKEGALGGTKSPICMACKDKNYTRHHCRVKNKHRELPWGTVYVTISAVPSAPGAPGFFNDSESEGGSIKSKRSFASTKTDHDEEPAKKRIKKDNLSDEEESESKDTPDADKVETLKDINTSRAFLLTVGKDDCTLSWLEIDTSVENQPPNEPQGAWSNQHPMDNMYPQPPFYPSGPPQGWSGNNYGFFPHNGNQPPMMPTSSMNNMPNQGGMQGPNGKHPGMAHGNGMHNNGRSTPNDFHHPNGGYPSNSSYPVEQGVHPAQMNKPPSQGPPTQFQNYPPHEDRENHGSLNMNQGPGMMNNNMGYPNKPFQHQNHLNEGPSMRNQGPSMNRNSPEHDYLPPSSKPDYANNNGNNGVGSLPQPPQPFVQREPGYNGHPPHNNSFNRGPSRDNFNVPPQINVQNGYGGGNMPFYSTNQP